MTVAVLSACHAHGMGIWSQRRPGAPTWEKVQSAWFDKITILGTKLQPHGTPVPKTEMLKEVGNKPIARNGGEGGRRGSHAGGMGGRPPQQT